MSRRSHHLSNRAHEIRIIAGQWRGRRLKVLNSPTLRPTTDRVRETVFNWLRPQLEGACCLDLFAGTGALSFEALSRGAKAVTMIDTDPEKIKLLKQHAKTLNSQNHRIKLTDAVVWLKQSTTVFDIIFLDPPFGQGHIERCCNIIQQQSLLSDNGRLYTESEIDLTIPSGWKVIKALRAGQVKAMLMQAQSW